MAEQEERFAVRLTEKEIDALIVTISDVRIAKVHACRICAVRDGFEELKSTQAEIRIGRE